MNRKEEILHQQISEAWNNTHVKGTAAHEDKQRLICHWNNGESGRSGNKMMTMGVKKGVSDWQWIAGNGLSVWIELKIEDGVQSVDQVRFANMCERLGHKYFICRDYYVFWELCGIEPPMQLSELQTK